MSSSFPLQKCPILALPKSRDASSKESSAVLRLRSSGSLRPHLTLGEAFWAISPNVAVTPYLNGTKQSISGPSDGLTGWELCTGRQVRKTSSICMICFNAGHFRFKMHLNDHPSLIPAAWIALYSAIDLIISSILFFLLWILSGKKTKTTVLHFVLSLDKLTFSNTFTKPVVQILC